MQIIATKKNTDSKIVFDLPDKNKSEAIKYARNSVRKTIKDNLKKRLRGWEFKVK